MEPIRIRSLSEVSDAARELLASLEGRRIVAFYGEMGAGKTTLIKALCEERGVDEIVTSPTFAIVNAYHDRDGEPIYHFDFYRIKTVEEAFDFGYEEYFFGGSLCLIEWPEKIEELLPEETLRVRLTVNDDNSRTLELF